MHYLRLFLFFSISLGSLWARNPSCPEGITNEVLKPRILQYSIYLATWEKNCLELVKEMIRKQTIHSNVLVYIAFANYRWDLGGIPGLDFITENELHEMVDTIHQAGAKVGLSIGGAAAGYDYYGSPLYGQSPKVAHLINEMVKHYRFDAVDFDVESLASNMPVDFPVQQAYVIKRLKKLNPGLHVNVTVSSQAWASNDYEQKLLQLTIDLIDSFTPMEWDLWLDPLHTYVQQIQWDIQYYVKTWGIPFYKINLGLLPGFDTLQKKLSLHDAVLLATWAADQNMHGVMVWDADNDLKGIDGNPSFAYTLGIESTLN